MKGSSNRNSVVVVVIVMVVVVIGVVVVVVRSVILNGRSVWFKFVVFLRLLKVVRR